VTNHPYLCTFASAVMLAVVSTASASDTTRQLDSHEHGHATLNVAVDGNSLAIEFESPAANIVGFEHKPENHEQEEAIEKAEAMLSQAGTMFGLPGAAGCTLAKVEVEAPHDDHHDDHKDEKHDDHKDEKHDDHEGEVHSEFHASWLFDCKSIDKLDSLEVKIFEQFPGTEEIDASVIGRSGQSAVELSASNTRVPLRWCWRLMISLSPPGSVFFFAERQDLAKQRC